MANRYAPRGPGRWGQNRPYTTHFGSNVPSPPPAVQKGGGLYTDQPPLAQPLPPDATYTGNVGAINLNYEQTIAGVGFDRTQLGQQYGFDAAGNLDPSNPYSIAANLQRRYQQGQQGTTNTFASRGQLYSGATQRNLDEGTYQYGRSYDAARRAAASGYQDLAEREQRAAFDKTVGLGDEAADRIGRLDPADTVPQATTVPRTAPVNVPRNIPSFRRRRRRR